MWFPCLEGLDYVLGLKCKRGRRKYEVGVNNNVLLFTVAVRRKKMIFMDFILRVIVMENMHYAGNIKSTERGFSVG